MSYCVKNKYTENPVVVFGNKQDHLNSSRISLAYNFYCLVFFLLPSTEDSVNSNLNLELVFFCLFPSFLHSFGDVNPSHHIVLNNVYPNNSHHSMCGYDLS